MRVKTAVNFVRLNLCELSLFCLIGSLALVVVCFGLHSLYLINLRYLYSACEEQLCAFISVDSTASLKAYSTARCEASCIAAFVLEELI
jgi:hypothetical protein